jgi:protein-disulfide isomerase
MTRLRLLLLLSLAPALAACSRSAERSPGTAASAATAPGPSRSTGTADGSAVVAEIDGHAILAADLDRRAESRLGRLRQEEYEIRKQALDELIWERLLEKEAARRGVTTEALLAREVDGKAKGPSDSQIDTIYEQNKGRFAGQSREDAVARIRMVLTQRAREARRAAYDEELRRQAKVAVRLAVPRAAVDIPAGAPSTGPDSAPVTIVEFTDYQCPYCHRAQAVVDELLDRYRGKVRLVHRDFPLEGHPGAFPAARAARCAGEQGRFWPYHRSLMTVTGPLDDADLEKRAAAADLDASKFAACVASPRNDDAIRASLAEGEALGVTGTPAYFINGRMLSGARPIEDFAEVIDAELAGR